MNEEGEEEESSRVHETILESQVCASYHCLFFSSILLMFSILFPSFGFFCFVF
jgi:hypothetical protein